MKTNLTLTSLANPKGFCLGSCDNKAVCLTSPKQNMVVTGSAGSGKSCSFARTNILTRIKRGESFVVSDPSGQLYKETFLAAQKNDYEIRVLNLKDLVESNGWNPLDSLKDTHDIESQIKAAIIANVILQNTQEAKTDLFFTQSEENLLKALILYVGVSPHFNGRSYDRNLKTVYKLLEKLADKGDLEELSNLPETDPAAMPWKMFKYSGKLQSVFITSLAARLEVLQSGLMQDILSHNEIDTFAPSDRKCAYYVINKLSDNKTRFIATLFFTCAIENLIEKAAKYKKGKVPVYFILDEFKALGRINAMSNKMHISDEFGVYIAILAQNIRQIDTMYANESEQIIDDCDVWLLYDAIDNKSLELLNKRSGSPLNFKDLKPEDVIVSIKGKKPHLVKRYDGQ